MEEIPAAPIEEVKKVIKKKVVSDLPPPVVWLKSENMSVIDVMSKAESWQNLNKVSQKLSSGTMSTAPFNYKAHSFNTLNTKLQ